MKICWLSDIHLNFIPEERVKEFFDSVREHDSSCVFITGDISESPVLSHHLTLIDQLVGKPVYFVLGNHDHWYTSTEHMRENLPKFVNQKTYLRWMSSNGPLMIDQDTCVVGHDGWYDCRIGDPLNSRFMMRDWSIMGDYVDCKNMQQIVDRSQQMAEVGIAHMKHVLQDACKKFKKVVILTHFPPYAETHVYNGRIGEPHAQPFFTNGIMGELIKAAAKAFPDTQFTVFAGHTHGRVTKQIANNLVVHVAGADYGSPQIQNVTSI